MELLNRSRSSKQGWVTKIINEGNQLINSDQLTYNKLKRLIDNLKTKWESYLNTIESLEAKIFKEEDKTGYDDLISNHESLETKYQGELDKFEAKLDELTTTNSPNGTSANIIELPRLTLPTISLPTFAGDISEWPSFWDNFNGLIHQRKDIAKTNKFSYLLGQLKGTAHLVVSQLAVTEDNYDIAIKLLKDNYEDKDQITSKLVNKLLDLPTPNHNYNELQLFRITVNSTLETLKLNNDVDAASWLIKVIIQRKLNKKTLETLYYKYSKSHFSLKEIDETLLDICKNLSNEEPVKDYKKDSKVNVNSQSKFKTAINKSKATKYNPAVSTGSTQFNNVKARSITPDKISGGLDTIGSYATTVNKTTTSSSNTNSTGAKPKTYRICVFCSELHNSKDCDKYIGTSHRLQRLSQLGRCTLCLSGYHQVQDCRTKLNKCSLCKKGIHHIVLCDSKKDELKPPSSQNNTLNCPSAVPTAEVQMSSKA